MPVCRDCGNTSAFVHRVKGTETRLYDETGDFDGTENQHLESEDCWCAECKSHNVVFDVDPENPSETSATTSS